MIEVHVEPGVTKTAEQFVSESPKFSIALDSYVAGPPGLFPGPRVNFDHHVGVVASATRSACGQVAFAIKKEKLFNYFKIDGMPQADIFVNHGDHDVCTSIWLLRNHERISGYKSEPLLTRLVSVIDLLDSSGGVYPLDPNSSVRQEFSWVFEPYSAARVSGRAFKMESAEMRNMIDAVCARISDYAVGKGRKIPLDTRYEKIGGGTGWALVKEIGFDARTGMLADDIAAFVSVYPSGNGLNDYAIARMNSFDPFPARRIYDALNQAEGIALDNPDRWNGSDNNGGSPRRAHSRLTPKELENVVEAVVRSSSDK